MKLHSGLCLIHRACLYSSKCGATCESLASLALPNATITLAQPVAAGEFRPPRETVEGTHAPAVRLKALPEFCRIAATLKPTDDSDIKIEVWLPASGWNGKFRRLATADGLG